jgi:hypothetical protein
MARFLSANFKGRSAKAERPFFSQRKMIFPAVMRLEIPLVFDVEAPASPCKILA